MNNWGGRHGRAWQGKAGAGGGFFWSIGGGNGGEASAVDLHETIAL